MEYDTLKDIPCKKERDTIAVPYPHFRKTCTKPPFFAGFSLQFLSDTHRFLSYLS